MEQVTQPTAPTDTRGIASLGESIEEAHALAGRIIADLSTWPRDIELHRELTGEYAVHVFWSHDVSGVCAIAHWASASWDLVPSDTGTGIWAETRTHVDGVALWAYTLLTRDEAEQARLMLPPPAPRTTTPDPAPADTPAVLPSADVTADTDEARGEDAEETVTVLPTPTAMPLGSSILAHATAITPPAERQAGTR